MLIGVLALQGDVREHQAALENLGVQTRLVKSAAQLVGIDGIVLPGGESTAQSKLLQIFGLMEPLRSAIASGLPALGTCAGLILLATSVEGLVKGQQTLGILEVTVERNAYGGQLESFESEIELSGVPIRAAFIRAPRIIDSGDTQVLARLGGEPVIVRQGNVFGSTCHPEISGDLGLHRLFIHACNTERVVF